MSYVPKSIREMQWWDDYYRWHEIPRPNFEPIPGDRVRTLAEIVYIRKPDGSIEIKIEHTGDPERDALELRLTSALSKWLEQRREQTL